MTKRVIFFDKKMGHGHRQRGLKDTDLNPNLPGNTVVFQFPISNIGHLNNLEFRIN